MAVKEIEETERTDTRGRGMAAGRSRPGASEPTHPVARAVHKLKNLGRTQRLRYGLMVVGILALAPPIGFLAQAFGGAAICGNLCPRMAIGPSFTRELVSRTAGVALLFTWFFVTFFFGRWICSHFCPAGALTEFASKILPKRLKIDYSRKIDTPLFRYGFMGAYLGLPIFGVASICCSFCNISVLPESFGAIFVSDLRAMSDTGIRVASIGVFVLAFGMVSMDGRGHCHMLCPIGALDSLVNAIGARLPFTWRVRVQKEKCSGCGLCVKECPAWAIKMDTQDKRLAKINYHRCYNCRKCEDKCPRDAIKIGEAA